METSRVDGLRVASDAASAPVEAELGRTRVQVVAAPAHGIYYDVGRRVLDEDAI